MEKFFVKEDSIVRRIWGSSDTILFIFAGASAEFALNKAVDWLYFTGRLPSDPIGRLFTTVRYAKQIVFAREEDAIKAIEQINQIHHHVEKSRGEKIPDWAYRDVLFMLIHYSIAAFNLLERPLKEAEKEEVFSVFYRMGKAMQIKDLPENFEHWRVKRLEHLKADLEKGAFSIDLYKEYRKHLGSFRFLLLKEVQKKLVPDHVSRLLSFQRFSLLALALEPYKVAKKIGFGSFIIDLLVPQAYRKEVRQLETS